MSLSLPRSLMRGRAGGTYFPIGGTIANGISATRPARGPATRAVNAACPA